MPISFNEIPDVKEPGIFAEIDNSGALSGLAGKESVMLVIGRKTDDGTAVVEKPVEISVKGEEADSLFGAGSEAARMIAAVRKNNTFNRLFCIPLANSTGTATAQDIDGMIREALTPLLNAGIIDDVSIAVSRSDDESASFELTVFKHSGQSETFVFKNMEG